VAAEAADLEPDPIALLRSWWAAARDAVGDADVFEPSAMTLATAGSDGQPSARTVLLRGLDARGLAFYTNRFSRKGRELAENPHAAGVLLWQPLHRQVTVAGTVEALPDAESDAYFAGRPRGSQLAAWASPQSEVLPDRDALEARLTEVTARFVQGPVPRPPHWGGYVLRPDRVEFWTQGSDRLHDRFRYTRVRDGWRVERLAP
jgi:pyridoxamine 5'-phosphate oxidase